MHTVPLREANVVTGLLRLESNRFTRAVWAVPGVIAVTPVRDTDRVRVSSFIKDTYRRVYGARIRVDYPNLISLRDTDGRVAAAAGFRFAALSPLFLEHYTGRPIDAILGVRRREIVEVGNLASLGSGLSVVLFAALASYLHGTGVSRVVITSTDSLERRLSLLGLASQRICEADPRRIAHTEEEWGTYYRRRPHVLAGRLDLAFERLTELFGAGFFLNRPRLFPRLHCMGEGA
ncbi:MAG: thermostable hemolysin [Arenicellales bacterium]